MYTCTECYQLKSRYVQLLFSIYHSLSLYFSLFTPLSLSLYDHYRVNIFVNWIIVCTLLIVLHSSAHGCGLHLLLVSIWMWFAHFTRLHIVVFCTFYSSAYGCGLPFYSSAYGCGLHLLLVCIWMWFAPFIRQHIDVVRTFYSSAYGCDLHLLLVSISLRFTIFTSQHMAVVYTSYSSAYGWNKTTCMTKHTHYLQYTSVLNISVN